MLYALHWMMHLSSAEEDEDFAEEMTADRGHGGSRAIEAELCNM